MKKTLLFVLLTLILGTSLCGCSSDSSEPSIPTLDQTVHSRNGDKAVFFEGDQEVQLNTSIESFINIYFKITNGELYVALEEDGKFYRTAIRSVDGLFVDIKTEEAAVTGDLYIFRGNRILYKITFVSEYYEPFRKEDLEKAFGKLTEIK